MLLSEWFRALVRPSTFRVQQQQGWRYRAVENLFPQSQKINKKYVFVPGKADLKPSYLRQVCFAVLVSWMGIFTRLFNFLAHRDSESQPDTGRDLMKAQSLFLILKKFREPKNLLLCFTISLFSQNPFTTFLPTQKAFKTTENGIKKMPAAFWAVQQTAACSSQVKANVWLGEYLLKIGTTDTGQLFLQVPWDVWLNEKCCNKANSVHKSANNSSTWSHCSHK